MHRTNLIKRLLRGSIDLLFPPQCMICNAAIPADDRGPAICQQCKWMLAPDDLIYCNRCGAVVAIGPKGAIAPSLNKNNVSQQKLLALSTYQPSDRTVAKCKHCPQRQNLRFEGAIALNQYEGELRRNVLRMKEITRSRPLTAAIAEYFVEYRRQALEELKVDVVTSIPLHWTKLLLRGSASPAIIAERIAKILNINLVPKGIIAIRRTKTQSKLTREQRITNVRGAYEVTKSYDFTGSSVLLVDDILTTGATCDEVSRILRRAGAARVTLAVIARSQYSQEPRSIESRA